MTIINSTGQISVLPHYSLESESIGFAFAAFTDRALIVISAIVTVSRRETIKGTKVDNTNGENPKFIR
jgi:hypothetical protein